jgi:hypothetical protein
MEKTEASLSFLNSQTSDKCLVEHSNVRKNATNDIWLYRQGLCWKKMGSYHWIHG